MRTAPATLHLQGRAFIGFSRGADFGTPRSPRPESTLAKMRLIGRNLGALVFCSLLGHCGRASETELRREPGGWLATCLIDADCAEGSCVCGVCTASCAQSDCSAGPPGSECISQEHWAHDGFCAGRVTERICVSTCMESSECAGSDRCVQGVCLPEAVASSLDPLSSPLCAADPVVYRSLRVTDQAQLDLLAGCEVIEGSLTLEPFPDADDTALESLREVTGKLTIDGEEGEGVPLPEFPRLEAAGHLFLHDVEIGAADPFPALRAIGRSEPLMLRSGQLYLLRCTGITDLGIFRAVQGIASLVLSGNPDLARVEGIENLLDLRELEVRGNGRLTSFAGLGDAPALRSVQIAANAGLESLAGLPPSLRSMLLMSNDGLQTLEGLESITHIGMTLSGNDSLRSLEGLSRLETGSLVIENNASLTSLAGLTALRNISSLIVRRNAALSSFGSWPALEVISELEVRDNAALQSMGSLGAVSIGGVAISGSAFVDLTGLEQASVEGSMTLSNNVRLETLSGAPALGPDAQLAIDGCPNLTDLSALSSLRSLGELSLTNVGVVNLDVLSGLERLGRLSLSENQSLVHADALSAVQGLSRLAAFANPVLERLPSFPQVLTIADEESLSSGALEVVVSANDSLIEAPGFPSVDRARSVWFESNPSLTGVTGFAELAAVGALQLVNNALLAELDFSSLREAHDVTIVDNPLLGPDQISPLLNLAPGSTSEELP